MTELPPVPKPDNGSILVGREEVCLGHSDEAMMAFGRLCAEEAVRRERKQLALPKSYGGSTLGSWADQKEGCTLRIHFTDAKEAAEWFDRLMDGWVRSRSEQGKG